MSWSEYTGQFISATSAAAVAGVFTMGVFYVNAVVPSYGVGGTIEGFHDPKFKRVLPKDAFTSFFVSLVLGISSDIDYPGNVRAKIETTICGGFSCF